MLRCCSNLIDSDFHHGETRPIPVAVDHVRSALSGRVVGNNGYVRDRGIVTE